MHYVPSTEVVEGIGPFLDICRPTDSFELLFVRLLSVDSLNAQRKSFSTDPDEQCSDSDSLNIDARTDEDSLEDLITSVGGHGRFQILVWSIGLGTKISVAMVFLYMSFAGATTDWWCVRGDVNGDDVVNTTVDVIQLEGNESLYKTCEVNDTRCSQYRFDMSSKTIVNEWHLVCDRKWVSSTVTSLQWAGILMGALLSGQVADIWGRRKTCIVLLACQVLSCLANAFSPTWIFFAATRFFTGLGGGGYQVVHLSLLMEFTDIKWRTLLGAVPTWHVGKCLNALVAWLLQDWQYVGIVCSVITLPFLIAWWFMPESIRWLLVHERVDEAQAILCDVARRNGKAKPDVSRTRALVRTEVSRARANRLYSFRDLFRSWNLTRRTLTLSFIWFSNGAVNYFFAFGAETLSGDLYVNIFLMAIADIPGVLVVGRRWTGFLFNMLAAVATLGIVIIHFTDLEDSSRSAVIRGLAFTAKLAVGGAGNALMVFTSENFPTVIRTIGIGACNTAARVGGILAPQLVFLYTSHPVLPYVISAVLMVGSSVGCLTMRETNDKPLEDVLLK
ncbi:hypothetical protein BaRGS_00002135 [Batillaria attramentaria]|uniref:Major facilitator superfamily (MFS) profile domain-containing protein n=1 Tax=Batillaria attramentaria TaxID=370345 RepID=A0ABD0M423_9CAEN